MRIDRYSLRWRLPLLVCGVTALVLVAFLWTAYLGVRTTLAGAAGDRAQGAADQIASLLDGARSADQMRQISRDPILRRFLETRSDEARTAALGRLTALAATQLRRVELWDAAGTRLLEVSIPDAAGGGRRLPPGSSPFVPGVHPLQAVEGTVFSDLVAEFRGPTDPIGFLLIRTTFTENPPGTFRRLVGSEAKVVVGNVRGDVWTDFRSVVTAPAVNLGSPGIAEYRDANGEWRLGAVSHVRTSQLAVWVEFPRAASMAPATTLLRQMSGAALVFLLVGAASIAMLTTRLTRPLSELSSAAEAISAGDYSRKVTESGRDEIGRLGRAFNIMAAKVREARQRLETRVVERTALLAAANNELEAFSYSVSHDLRAPLRSIDGFSQALLEDAAHKLDMRDRDHLRRVRAAAQRMGVLIDDLLQLSRVGRTDFNRQHVDVSALGGVIADNPRRSEPARQVSIGIQEGMVASADRNLLQIVMENLLGNAWKFTANVREPMIQLGREQTGAGDAYFVRDNGAGFDMAYADKLFQPFQRLHGERDFPGTGIGLATVRRIVERHGGRVWAQGSVGAGATIYFSLDAGQPS